MRLPATARALPAMFKVSFAESVAYRAEFLVWMLSTTMPLIMLALWSAVAREGPVGRFGQPEFVAYFLATFIVRQLTGSWAAWQMNYEIRHGTLAQRLLRPIHPMLTFAVENLAAQPMRLLVALPVAVLWLWTVGAGQIPRDPALWIAFGAALLGSWLINFLANFAIGCLAFFTESSIKVMEVWLTLFFVFSGYLIPVELFPPSMRAVTMWMPFHYQLGLPVELITSAHDPEAALRLLGLQWAWVAAMLGAAILMWRRGLARFASYGG
ncbi:MAG TPA: ABC-2 family transporter protein [Candidatus Polarisedimenticolia bacterium]|nr:ABC-2 family transporter protein [Candidatus Polarisedimenticolia bacterium]